MSWEKYAYTSAGAAMLSESISGGALTITRAVSGTGTVDTDLSEETAVSGDTYELKLLGIDTVEYEGEKARKVSIWTGGADKPYFMHQIGVVKNPSEEALASYVKRITGVDALQWINGDQAETLIESLKKWAMRFLPATVERLLEEARSISLSDLERAQLNGVLSRAFERRTFDPMYWAWESLTNAIKKAKVEV